EEVFIVFRKTRRALVHIASDGQLDFGKRYVEGRQIRMVEVGKKILVYVMEKEGWRGKDGPVPDHFVIGKGWETPKPLPGNTVSGVNRARRMEQAIRLSDGRLLANTKRGLFAQLTPDGPMECLDKTRDVTYMFQDSDDWVWEARFNHGIKVYAPEDLVNPRFHWMKDKSVAGFVEDFEGGIWIAMGDEGLYYVARKTLMTQPHTDQKVLRVDRDADGNRVELRKGHQVWYWKAGSPRPRNLSEELGVLIPRIIPPVDRSFFGLLSNKGVYTVDTKTGEPHYICNAFVTATCRGERITDSLLYLRSGEKILYVGKKGVKKVLNTKVAFYEATAASDSVWYLFNFAGLYKYDHGEVTKIFPEEGHLEVRHAVFEGDTLLAGTQGAGLLVVTPDTMYTLNQDDGLQSDFISHIQQMKNGTVLLSTDRGMCRLEWPFTPHSAISIGANDGLNDPDLAGVLEFKDSLKLVSSTASYFIASSDLRPSMPSATAPELFVHLGDSLLPETAASLSYDQNTLRFAFKSIAFQHPVRYRYRMVGQDEAWIETDRTDAYLSGLAPGAYRFEVQARYAHESWPATSVARAFSIRPAFWQTWWFLALLVAGVVLAVLVSFRYILARVRRRAALRQQMLALKSEALRSQMNPHFTYNALNSIQSFITGNDKTRAANFLSDFAAMMRDMLEHSREDFISIEEEKILLERYLKLEQLRFPNRFDFTIDIDPELDEELDEIPAMLVQPLVENAILHGVQKSEGYTQVRIYFDKLEEGMLRCRVWNDGPELETANGSREHRSLGLKILAERLENLSASGMGQGEFVLLPGRNVSEGQSGVCAQLTLPYKNGI
ncbi:MAG: histidine kinase, partial [Bacteroidota bacterium]